MPKFKVGDKVIFVGDVNSHLNSSELREVYDNKTVLEISYLYEDNKQYDVKDKIWTFEEYELEHANKMFEIGTIVKPIPACIGNEDVFKVIGYDGDKYFLEQLTFNGKTLNPTQLVYWNYSDLRKTPLIECTMDTVTQQVLADIKKPMYIDKIQNQIEAYEEMFSKEGENYMKILEIYSREAFSKIDEKYDELEKEVRENDSINKIIQDASNQINVLLDRDEKNAISLVPSGIYSELLELKSSEKIVELKHDRDREKIKVEKLIEEVKARLEICDDNETSKVAVLKEYGILTSDGRIAEYKIEKKGRK